MKRTELCYNGVIPMASGDERRQWQILSNLLTNACKYSCTGTLVRVTVHREENLLVVAVVDEGAGISPEHRDLVFEKFQRIGSFSEDRTMRGTGLGLYICRSLVEAQGGTISVDGGPDSGSRLWYTVPVVEVL